MATYTHMYTNEYMQNWWNLNQVDGRYQFSFCAVDYADVFDWWKLDEGYKGSFCIISYNCMWSVIPKNFIYLLYMPVCIFVYILHISVCIHINICICLWKWKVLVALSTSLIPMHYSLPGSSVHGILQVGIWNWVAILLPHRLFLNQELNPGLLHYRFFIVWATREAHIHVCVCLVAQSCLTL